MSCPRNVFNPFHVPGDGLEPLPFSAHSGSGDRLGLLLPALPDSEIDGKSHFIRVLPVVWIHSATLGVESNSASPFPTTEVGKVRSGGCPCLSWKSQWGPVTIWPLPGTHGSGTDSGLLFPDMKQQFLTRIPSDTSFLLEGASSSNQGWWHWGASDAREPHSQEFVWPHPKPTSVIPFQCHLPFPTGSWRRSWLLSLDIFLRTNSAFPPQSFVNDDPMISQLKWIPVITENLGHRDQQNITSI